jgi:hypothetical protein
MLIWLGDYHYEPVGKLLPQNRIQREFNSDDELIKTIDTFISKPKQLLDKNPQLGKYVNREVNSGRRKGDDEKRPRERRPQDIKSHKHSDSDAEDSDAEDSDAEDRDAEDSTDEDTNSVSEESSQRSREPVSSD